MGEHQWPIDFDSLVEDSVIEQQTIEHAYAVRYSESPTQYAFKVLELIQEIERNRSDLKPRVMGQAVRLMTDPEAEAWYEKLWKQNKNALVNIGKRRGRVDRSSFTEQQLAKSNSIDIAIAATILTARSESKRHNRMLAVMEAHQLPKDGK